MDKETQIASIADNKLCVIACISSDDRKKIHQYIETIYPTLKKTSLYIKCLTAEEKLRFATCYECGNKSVSLSNYHNGTAPSNIDEYYSGECSKCYTIIRWECNYDNTHDLRIMHHNNVIVIGNYVKSYNKPRHCISDTHINKTEFTALLESSGIRLFEIDAPQITNGNKNNWKPLNKRKLQEYISTSLEKLI
jgi:hypothetical protein